MDNLLDIPLSLQDMCMLCIVFQIEDFPVQSLALLPHEIRRKLLFGLSHADVLHLADTTLFDDVDSNRDYPQVSHARQCLVDVILSGGQILSLQLKNVLKWFSRDEYRYDSSVESSLFDHICKCYPSLKPTKIKTNYCNYCILPKRTLPFVQLLGMEGVVDIYDVTIQKPVEPIVLISPLLNYCNVHSAPTELKIDCHNFKSSTFWKEFDKVVETAFNASRDEYGYPIKGANTKVDLVIPVLQEFLSSVEVLELGTESTPRDVDGLEEDMHTVPFVLLYNVISSSKPRLKHLKVYGIPLFLDWVLETLMELLDGNCTSTKSMFTAYRCVEVLSPLTTPYMLEEISVSPEDRGWGYGFEYMLTSYASSLSCGIMSIVENHKEKLKSVTVNDLGYCYDYDNLNVRDLDDRIEHIRGKRNINVPSYRALLSSFVQFVKRPSFTDLSVGKSPLPEAYELIKTFLCTPAIHKQSLTIEASSERSVPEMEELEDEEEDEEQEEEEKENEDEDEEKNQETMETGSTLKEDSRKRELVTELSETPSQKIMKPTSPVVEQLSFSDQPLPESNVQYKCLDLGFSSSCVYSWLFTIPELKLKKLRMRTQDMTIVPADMVIQVEHVAFTTEDHFSTSYKPTITPAHLEKFIVSNSALKRLEFTDSTDECVPDLIPALNHCLSTLYQQGRGLEELILNRVEFQNIEHMKEFFIRVRDLSHRHGTTLVLSLKYYQLTNSYVEESRIFENFSKDFQDKKIKKIDCTVRDDRDPSSYLSLIAEIVDVHYPRPPSFF